MSKSKPVKKEEPASPELIKFLGFDPDDPKEWEDVSEDDLDDTPKRKGVSRVKVKK